jgi:hypothetical protein
MTTTPDFRAELERLVDLYEALGGNWSPHGYTDLWNDALAGARAALATPPPEPPTPCITFCAPPAPKEVIRIDKEGFHYKGQFVADAGEAHRLMVAFLKQNTNTKPEPPTELPSLLTAALKLREENDLSHLFMPKLSPPPEPSEPPTDEERLADFAQWLAREMPRNTVIGDPLWWAPRIARAVLERWGQR